MFGRYFYHQHTRRAVSVFGTLFNNISIRKTNAAGDVLSTIKVPISYGPAAKFLTRLEQEPDLEAPGMAIRLPRMAFEITSYEYDTLTKLQKGIRRDMNISEDGLRRESILNPVTYKLGFTLYVISKTMDDALQIIEQIIPFFQPEYSVTVKEINDTFRSDMSFLFDSITSEDNYEGDFATTRHILYTLSFTTRVRYFGPTYSTAIIKETNTSISDTKMKSTGTPYSQTTLKIIPREATKDEPYEIEATFDNFVSNRVKLMIGTTDIDWVGQNAMGNISGTVGKIIAVDDDYILVDAPDGRYEIGETIQIGTETPILINIEEVWTTLL